MDEYEDSSEGVQEETRHESTGETTLSVPTATAPAEGDDDAREDGDSVVSAVSVASDISAVKGGDDSAEGLDFDIRMLRKAEVRMGAAYQRKVTRRREEAARRQAEEEARIAREAYLAELHRQQEEKRRKREAELAAMEAERQRKAEIRRKNAERMAAIRKKEADKRRLAKQRRRAAWDARYDLCYCFVGTVTTPLWSWLRCCSRHRVLCVRNTGTSNERKWRKSDRRNSMRFAWQLSKRLRGHAQRKNSRKFNCRHCATC